MPDALLCPDRFIPAPSMMASFADNTQFPLTGYGDTNMDGVVNRAYKGLVGLVKGRNIEAQPAPEDPDREVRDQAWDVVLKIDPEYGEQWRGSRSARVELIYDSSRQDSQIPVARIDNLRRAAALLEGRDFVTPDDVKRMALPALRHRIQPAPELELEGRDTDAILKGLLEKIEAPRK